MDRFEGKSGRVYKMGSNWIKAVSKAKPADTLTNPSQSLGRHTGERVNAHVTDMHNGHFGEVRVDMPNQHGNNRPHPVIHRTSGTRGLGMNMGGETRFNRPGVHANNRNHMTLHRDFIAPARSPVSVLSRPNQHSWPVTREFHRGLGVSGQFHREHGQGTRTQLHNLGQHSNLSPVPSAHTGGCEPHEHAGEIHVDRPFEHGNLSPVPVVHRECTPHAHPGTAQANPPFQRTVAPITATQHGTGGPVSGMQLVPQSGQQMNFLPRPFINGDPMVNSMFGMIPFPQPPDGMAPFSTNPFGIAPFLPGTFPMNPIMRRRMLRRRRILNRMNRLENVNTQLTSILSALVRRLQPRA